MTTKEEFDQMLANLQRAYDESKGKFRLGQLFSNLFESGEPNPFYHQSNTDVLAQSDAFFRLPEEVTDVFCQQILVLKSPNGHIVRDIETAEEQRHALNIIQAQGSWCTSLNTPYEVIAPYARNNRLVAWTVSYDDCNSDSGKTHSLVYAFGKEHAISVTGLVDGDAHDALIDETLSAERREEADVDARNVHYAYIEGRMEILKKYGWWEGEPDECEECDTPFDAGKESVLLRVNIQDRAITGYDFEHPGEMSSDDAYRIISRNFMQIGHRIGLPSFREEK